MLTYLKGDIFSSPAQVLVNTVNTVGVMGKGVALEYKNRYPEMFRYYQGLCDEGKFGVGNLALWKSEDKWILLFPTKKHWRNPSQMEYIEAGLKKFVASYYKMGIESIAFPRLGCGNGQLRWEDVQPVMEKYLSDLPIQIFVYVDQYKEELPEHKQIMAMEKWLHSNVPSIGFSTIKEDIQKRIADDGMLPLQNGKFYHVEWNENIVIIKDGTEKKIEEKLFCRFWNYVRETGVFKTEDLPQEFEDSAEYMIEMLKSLDYLQNIIVSPNGFDFEKDSNGFQYVGK